MLLKGLTVARLHTLRQSYKIRGSVEMSYFFLHLNFLPPFVKMRDKIDALLL